jgi:hypothetical protein
LCPLLHPLSLEPLLGCCSPGCWPLVSVSPCCASLHSRSSLKPGRAPLATTSVRRPGASRSKLVPPRALRRRAARSPPTAARSSQEHRRPAANVRRFCCFRPPCRPIVRRRQQEDTTTAARRPRWLVPPPEELHCAEPVPAAVTVICYKSVRPRLLPKKSLRPSCPSFVARRPSAVRLCRWWNTGHIQQFARTSKHLKGSATWRRSHTVASPVPSRRRCVATSLEHKHPSEQSQTPPYRSAHWSLLCQRASPPCIPNWLPSSAAVARSGQQLNTPSLLPAVSQLPCSGKDSCYCGCSPGLN